MPTAAPPAEDGYLPSAGLRRAVNRIHSTCVAPTCSIPSSSCQPDHVIPYPTGRTELGNLLPLCARHHLLKTHRGHSYTHDHERGTVTWTTATGHTYIRDPGGITTHRSPRASPT
ncbi:HNH endonuclease signature motif containing protein [Salana multivorans]